MNTLKKNNFMVGTEDKEEIENKNGEVEVVTCFIIRSRDNKVLVQKRAENLLRDPGQLDLCSGHILPGELPIQAMAREAKEELGMDPVFTIDHACKMGEIKVELARTEKKITYHCYIYAMREDESQLAVRINQEEVEKELWVSYEDLISCIQKNQTRFPYTKRKEKEYEEIFNKIRTQYLIKDKDKEKEQKENGGEER